MHERGRGLLRFYPVNERGREPRQYHWGYLEWKQVKRYAEAMKNVDRTALYDDADAIYR